MPFGVVWENIQNHAGEIFHTVRGLDFVYTLERNQVHTSRTEYNIPRSSFERAYEHWPLAGPGAMPDSVT